MIRGQLWPDWPRLAKAFGGYPHLVERI